MYGDRESTQKNAFVVNNWNKIWNNQHAHQQTSRDCPNTRGAAFFNPSQPSRDSIIVWRKAINYAVPGHSQPKTRSHRRWSYTYFVSPLALACVSEPIKASSLKRRRQKWEVENLDQITSRPSACGCVAVIVIPQHRDRQNLIFRVETCFREPGDDSINGTNYSSLLDETWGHVMLFTISAGDISVRWCRLYCVLISSWFQLNHACIFAPSLITLHCRKLVVERMNMQLINRHKWINFVRMFAVFDEMRSV